MKKGLGWLVALSASIVMANASDIAVSWESTGVLIAEGMSPGSTCTVEWASSLEQPFTHANDAIVFNEMVADSNGIIRLAIPMVFRAIGTAPPEVPEGMVLIPAGTNSGTNPLDEGESFTQAYPENYSLTVAKAFFMDSTEVTKIQWDTVYNWAVANGYSFDNAGSGKESNHPVQMLNWYDCVKWCNARSQKEGRTPCYTLSGSIYKTGQHAPACNTDLNGYRLPTSVEWEYAARGGLSSKRFPWGDTITHSEANYESRNSYSYDTSLTRGDHPSYNEGGQPYTSPVDAFAANGYGLYDMAGNVWEWCWDLSGSSRHFRGGSWFDPAIHARCGYGNWYDQAASYSSIGLRAVCR